MSQQNVDVVRRIYAVWGEEGSPIPSGLLDPDIEWVNAPEAIEPGVRHGVEAFGDAAESVAETFHDARVDIDEMLDVGNQVVVLATLRGRGRGSGADVERRQGYVWTLRDGKATRFQWFNSPEEALTAAGVHCQPRY